jgi:hypothetical protein
MPAVPERYNSPVLKKEIKGLSNRTYNEAHPANNPRTLYFLELEQY